MIITTGSQRCDVEEGEYIWNKLSHGGGGMDLEASSHSREMSGVLTAAVAVSDDGRTKPLGKTFRWSEYLMPRWPAAGHCETIV